MAVNSAVTNSEIKSLFKILSAFFGLLKIMSPGLESLSLIKANESRLVLSEQILSGLSQMFFGEIQLN